MDKQAGSIESSELKEVARLVKQAASVIDQMLVLNTSIDLAAANAVNHYRNEAQAAGQTAGLLIAGSKALETERETKISTLTARVAELEAVTAQQKSEIEALRLLIWPNLDESS